jgi:hypothetical protein
MKKRFFITGFPRTRTAWMSVLLTTKQSFCYHEIMQRAGTESSITNMIEQREEPYVGSSGSDIPLFMEHLILPNTNFPIVVIERDSDSINNSLRGLFGDKAFNLMNDVSNNINQTLNERLNIIKKLPNTIRVNYNELNNENTIRKIWRHCLPTVPFDKERWEILKTMQIQKHTLEGLIDKEDATKKDLEKELKKQINKIPSNLKQDLSQNILNFNKQKINEEKRHHTIH